MKSPPRSPLIEDAPRIAARGGSTRMRHFDGSRRKTSDWDGLRRDNQLWSEAADCLVYFYSHKGSQRGASLRIPFTAVESLNCRYLTERCLRKCDPIPVPDKLHPSNQRYAQIRGEPSIDHAKYELYIPAPTGFTREQAFAYHLTTRNLMAYTMALPLVGERLSIALINLWKRFQEWDMPAPVAGFTDYLEKQGYLDFTESTEHSLACLKFAEDARLRDIWIESFVHCVGMHERLDLSPEFATINKTTAALIMRASLEMDLHIGRVIRALGSFLEDELSVGRVGLPKATRDHLDLFRSFLHGFYVNRFGYYPPRMTAPWNKRPWASMCSDFQSLYDYLADTESSPDWTNNRTGSGGFCIVQNVQSFDLRHGYPSLPHPLPLIPQKTTKSKTSSKGLRTMSLSKASLARGSSTTSVDAYFAASNSLKSKQSRCALVQEYQRFERDLETSKAKLDLGEARKVRWLLIYGVLQMLNSVIKAPAQVRDVETPSYPLCVLVAGCPPWKEGEEEAVPQTEMPSNPQTSSDKFLIADIRPDFRPSSPSRISIHPDCEAECAEDFFATRNLARQDSTRSQSSVTAPLKRTSSIRSSMHSSVHALQRSMVGSLSRRNSSRRASFQPDSKHQSPFCEIIVEHYDDGRDWKDETIHPNAPQTILEPPRPADPIAAFDFGFPTAAAAAAEPILEPFHLDDDLSSTGPLDSDESDIAAHSSSSARSSYLADETETPNTELSSWMEGGDGGSRRDSETSLSSLHISPLLLSSNRKRQSSYEPSNPNVGKKRSYINLNGGTYVPKGMGVGIPVLQHRAGGKKGSVDSGTSLSSAASVYPEQAVQAADIDEVTRRCGSMMMGREGLERLADYGIVLGERNVW